MSEARRTQGILDEAPDTVLPENAEDPAFDPTEFLAQAARQAQDIKHLRKALDDANAKLSTFENVAGIIGALVVDQYRKAGVLEVQSTKRMTFDNRLTVRVSIKPAMFDVVIDEATMRTKGVDNVIIETAEALAKAVMEEVGKRVMAGDVVQRLPPNRTQLARPDWTRAFHEAARGRVAQEQRAVELRESFLMRWTQRRAPTAT